MVKLTHPPLDEFDPGKIRVRSRYFFYNYFYTENMKKNIYLLKKTYVREIRKIEKIFCYRKVCQSLQNDL